MDSGHPDFPAQTTTSDPDALWQALPPLWEQAAASLQQTAQAPREAAFSALCAHLLGLFALPEGGSAAWLPRWEGLSRELTALSAREYLLPAGREEARAAVSLLFCGLHRCAGEGFFALYEGCTPNTPQAAALLGLSLRHWESAALFPALPAPLLSRCRERVRALYALAAGDADSLP